MMEYAWHVHHGYLVEGLTRPMSDRKQAIQVSKNWVEVPLRLRLFKKVKDQKAIRAILKEAKVPPGNLSVDSWVTLPPTARRKLHELHKLECPNCPFVPSTRNSLSGNIFSKKAKVVNGRYV